MRPKLISIYNKEFYHREVVKKLISEANVKFGSFLPLGRDLSKKILGIIGLGRIGTEVAKRAFSFDITIMYTDIIRNKEAEQLFNATYLPLEELLRKSDYISIHLPLTKETRELISDDQLKLMKKSAYLVNTLRRAIINQKDLTNAFHEKRIAGAGLDVFTIQPIPGDDPILKFDNVILSRLMCSATVETFKRIGLTAIDNILRVLHGAPPKNLVPEQYGKTF